MDVFTRLQALERAVAGLLVGGTGGTEALQPSYLTLTPGGLIGANFTGVISAQGVTLPEGSSASPPPASKIIWNDTGGTLREVIFGFKNGPVQHVLTGGSQADANDSAAISCSSSVAGALGSAQVSAAVNDSFFGSASAVIVRSDGAADFLHAAGAQKSTVGQAILTWPGAVVETSAFTVTLTNASGNCFGVASATGRASDNSTLGVDVQVRNNGNGSVNLVATRTDGPANGTTIQVTYVIFGV